MNMNKIYNPESGKFIKQGTITFKKLLTKFTFENGIFVPKDKTNFAFSKIKQLWIAPTKNILKNYNKVNNILELKSNRVLSPSNRYISVNGPTYNRLIKQGYQHINDTLVYKPQTYNDLSIREFAEVADKLRDELKVVIFTELNNNERFSYLYRGDFHEMVQYYRTISYDKNFKIHFILKSTYAFGPAFDGKNNCFIETLDNYYKINKLDTKYPNEYNNIELLYKIYKHEGVFNEDINFIAKELRLHISAHVNNKLYEYKYSNCHSKPILRIKYDNNHIEQYNTIIESKINIKSELYIHNNLSSIIPLLSNITNIIIQHDEIMAIFINNKLMYKTNKDIITLPDNYITMFQYLTDDIHNYFTNPIFPIKSDHYFYRQLITNQIFYSNSNNQDTIKIDINSSYDHFKELPTDLLIKIETDKFIDKIGYSYITYQNPLTKNIETKWRGNNFIKEILIKYNIPFTISQAILSTNSTILNIKEFYKFHSKAYKYEKRIFHIILGKWSKVVDYKYIQTTDQILATSNGGEPLYNYTTNQIIQPNDSIYSHENILYSYKENSTINDSNYYPHVVGYIHEYTNITIMDTILKNNIKTERVWVDGIDLGHGKINNNIFKNDKLTLKLPNGFKFEMSKKYRQEDIISFNHEALKDLQKIYYNLPEQHISIITGYAGTGKSYLLKYISSIFKTTILTPTHLVKRMYTNAKTIDSYIFDPKSKSEDIILIDEYSMVSQEKLDIIKNKSRAAKIILFGDANQLDPISGTKIKDYPTIKLTKIYRTKDEEFIKNQINTLETGNIKYINQYMTIEEAIKSKSYILSSLNSNIDKINKIGLELNQNEFKYGIKKDMPFIISTNKIYNNLCNGDYGTIIDIKDNIILKIGDDIIELNPKYKHIIKPAYSITYHKMQGQTIDTKNIVIDERNLEIFDKYKMLYVGVSRARNQSQLYKLSL